MDAKVTWKHGLSFSGVADSGFEVPLGTSTEHGGEGDGTSPMELILIGLGGCTGMDVISILEKKQQKVTHFELKLHGVRSETHPKVYKEITLEYIVTGHAVDPEAVKRAVELSETKYCSVSAMISKTAEIKTKITVLEG
jgi:putative redox protein